MYSRAYVPASRAASSCLVASARAREHHDARDLGIEPRTRMQQRRARIDLVREARQRSLSAFGLVVAIPLGFSNTRNPMSRYSTRDRRARFGSRAAAVARCRASPSTRTRSPVLSVRVAVAHVHHRGHAVLARDHARVRERPADVGDQTRGDDEQRRPAHVRARHDQDLARHQARRRLRDERSTRTVPSTAPVLAPQAAEEIAACRQRGCSGGG